MNFFTRIAKNIADWCEDDDNVAWLADRGASMVLGMLAGSAVLITGWIDPIIPALAIYLVVYERTKGTHK